MDGRMQLCALFRSPEASSASCAESTEGAHRRRDNELPNWLGFLGPVLCHASRGYNGHGPWPQNPGNHLPAETINHLDPLSSRDGGWARVTERGRRVGTQSAVPLDQEGSPPRTPSRIRLIHRRNDRGSLHHSVRDPAAGADIGADSHPAWPLRLPGCADGPSHIDYAAG